MEALSRPAHVNPAPAPAAWVRGTARWVLIAVFAWAAGGKLFWPAEFRALLGELGLLPDASIGPLAFGLPACELALALWLASGRFAAAALALAFFLSACFVGVHGYALASGTIVPCGCAGVSITFSSRTAHAVAAAVAALAGLWSLYLLMSVPRSPGVS